MTHASRLHSSSRSRHTFPSSNVGSEELGEAEKRASDSNKPRSGDERGRGNKAREAIGPTASTPPQRTAAAKGACAIYTSSSSPPSPPPPPLAAMALRLLRPGRPPPYGD